jgi:hypothetical protein
MIFVLCHGFTRMFVNLILLSEALMTFSEIVIFKFYLGHVRIRRFSLFDWKL